MAGNVRVVLKSVFDDKGINQAQKAFGGLSSTFGKVAATLGTVLSVRAIGDFARNSVKAASDLEESMNAVNVAFGDSAKAIQDLGKTASTSLGTSQVEFNQAAVRFSAFADRIVGSGGDASKFIKEITQRASDFASVFNIEVSEALQVFQSGLAGEAEPLKRFGINLLDSEVKAYAMANGIGEVGRQLTETEKVQARYGLLLQSTAKTAGDFANTSDGLANSQRIIKAQFADLQATIGNALLPAVTKLFQAFAAQLLPKMREFGDWLKSPAGIKAVNDLSIAVGKAFDSFFKFLDFIVKNWRGLSEFATAALSAYTAVKLATGAIQIATTAQLLFNTAVKANPYMLAVTALLALVSAATAFAVTSDRVKFSAQAQADQISILEDELDALHRSYNSGAMDMNEYERQVQFLTEKLNTAKISVEGTAGEMRRLNDLRLDAATESMNRFKLATSFATRQAESFRKSYDYLISIGAVTPRVPTTPTEVGPTVSEGRSGPSKAEQIKDVLKDSQEAINSATKSYRAATKSATRDYNASVTRANEAYKEAVKTAEKIRSSALAQAASDNAQAITRINADTAKKLADIIAQSINRLRDAFRSAVQTNVADMFATEEVGKSVDNLVASLRDRLQASQRLIQNSAALSAAGFSQTFIEQVVGAGLTAGNELAESVLNATPETQEELRSLFGALETTSETGMDKLSQSIYDGTGLATTALKQLYADTLTEQTNALAEQAANYTAQQVAIMAAFDLAMQEAATTRDTALADAMKAYQDALKKAMDDFLLELDEVEKKFKAKLLELKAQKKDIDKLQAQIDAAKNVVPTPIKIATVIPTVRDTGNGTTINVNVKTDSTKSDAQVGEDIVKVINKYTNRGGALVTGRAAL